MLTLSLALAVAGGGSFLEWSSMQPRRVLFVDGEMNSADLKERAEALLSTVEGINVEAAEANLVFLARHSQDPDSRFPDLATSDGQRYATSKARRGKFDLLILDNFSTLFTCEDENAAAAFNEVVAFLMRLKQASIACLLVHHTNKGGESYRGSSKLATTFEVILGLTKGTDSRDDDGPAFEMTWDKFRGKRRDAVTMPRRVHLGEILGELKWQSEKSPKAHILELVAAVKSMKFATQDSLADQFRVSKGTISKWKTAAVYDYGLLTEKAWDEYLAQASGDMRTHGRRRKLLTRPLWFPRGTGQWC